MIALLLLACGNEPVAPAAPAEPAATAAPAAEPAAAAAAPSFTWTVALGTEPDAAAAVSIDDVLAKAAELDGKPVVVKASVAAVCQKKGCWTKLATANPDVTVFVKDADYKIFLPGDAAGKTAVVSGIFKRETLSVEEAKHYAEDAGKDPATVTGPIDQYAIDVDGVKFLGV